VTGTAAGGTGWGGLPARRRRVVEDGSDADASGSSSAGGEEDDRERGAAGSSKDVRGAPFVPSASGADDSDLEVQDENDVDDEGAEEEVLLAYVDPCLVKAATGVSSSDDGVQMAAGATAGAAAAVTADMTGFDTERAACSARTGDSVACAGDARDAVSAIMPASPAVSRPKARGEGMSTMRGPMDLYFGPAVRRPMA